MQHSDDAVFDVLLKQACAEFAETETSAMLDEHSAGPPFEPSKKYSKIILAYGKKADPQRNRLRAKQRTRRIFLVAILLAILMSVSVTVSAFRTGLFNFMVKDDAETHMTFRVSEPMPEYAEILAELPAEWEGIYVPSQFPFEECEIESFILNSYVTIMFTESNDENFVVLQQSNAPDITLLMDTEFAEAEMAMVGEYQAYRSQRDGISTLVWTNNDYVFSLSSSLPYAETTTIAEDIIKLRK